MVTKSKGKAAKTAAKGTTTAAKLERHPLSEKYGPPVTQEEMVGLGTDMKEHGQHDDIILYEGKVLAGWNRYMACLQQGLKPKTKEMDEGQDPVAVAFGTNFVRRRLNSVQKALYGAQFALDTNAKQTDIAKLVGCNLNRLNQCCQLLKMETAEAREAVEKLRSNPEISGGVFEGIIAELGLARRAETPAADRPLRTNTHIDDDDDFDDVLGGGDDDLTGGAIDSLLDVDDEEPGGVEPRKRREVGEGADPLPATGTRPGNGSTSAKETIPSRMAKAFRKLSPEDQVKFVKFCGTKLAVAVNAAVGKGDFTLDIAKPQPTPEPEPGKKRSGKVDPSVIVPMPLKKGKEAAAKKAAAKKSAKK